MKLDSSLSLRKMGAQYVIYRVNPSNGERSMVVLNDTAAFLWKKFVDASSFSIEDIAQALVEEYEIDMQTAIADATTLVNNWVEGGVAKS